MMKGKLGYGYINSICTHSAITIIDIGKNSNYNPKAVGETVVHEIGHNLGFQHSTNTPDCECGMPGGNFYCIMNEKRKAWNGPQVRSIEHCALKQNLNNLYTKKCLLEPSGLPRLLHSCGDGIVDKGEACDCGHKQLCSTYTDRENCCNEKTCQFRSPNYKCLKGKCCKKCKFSKGSVCRSKSRECSSPGVCDGTSSKCPKNKIARNNEICNNKKGLCFEGNCVNLNYYCQREFKNTKITFSEECVMKLRSKMTYNCPVIDKKNMALNRYLCKDKPRICDHLVCSAPIELYVRDSNYFVHKDRKCIFRVFNSIPDYKGFNAPEYMPCNVHINNTKSYCWKKSCVNNPTFKNCKKGVCKNSMQHISARTSNH